MTHQTMALVGRNHDALHMPAADVVDLDEARALADRMRATLAVHRGYALAACQVGRPLRLVVFENGTAVINPDVAPIGDATITAREGCLTLPGRFYLVPRASSVGVVATVLDGLGTTFMSKVVDDELAARVWQHEADHLAGLLLRGRFDEDRSRR